METNYICGEVLGRATAQHYLELTQSFYNLITYTLDCDSRYDLASQKQDTWSLRSTHHPDPLDENISDIKSRIHSRHVGFCEDWKEIKFRPVNNKWPEHEHEGSLWNTFDRAMDQDRPIYEMRNWFSHEFGKRGGTLEVKNEMFKGLQEAYKNFLPCLDELLSKLGLALQDGAAWAPQPEVKARRSEEHQPEYTKDTMVVQLQYAARQEKNLAMLKQVEIDYAATVARVERTGEAWKEEEWVATEDVGEEWVGDSEEGVVPWTNLPDLDYASNMDDDTSECTDDSPATSVQGPDDRAYDSGYEDNDEPPSSLCKALAPDAEYISAKISYHGDESREGI